MREIMTFDPITVSVSGDKIYTRMGYVQGVTSCSRARQKEIDQALDEGRSLCRIRGTALRLGIRENRNGHIILSSGTILLSNDLGRMIEDCEEVLLMAVTAGSSVTAAISRASEDEGLFRGVVYDAVASELVDAGLQWIMDYVNRQLSRERKHCLKRRFSAGYGDLELKTQKKIYDLLDLNRLDIKISPGYMLVPEKSVTAVTGIKKTKEHNN